MHSETEAAITRELGKIAEELAKLRVLKEFEMKYKVSYDGDGELVEVGTERVPYLRCRPETHLPRSSMFRP